MMLNIPIPTMFFHEVQSGLLEVRAASGFRILDLGFKV
jgi:hypothetical protein